MLCIKRLSAVFAVLALGAGPASAVAATVDGALRESNVQSGVIDFRLPINPDPIIQHAKEAYILNGCVYCHGLDLGVRNGEAADLYNSPLVAADQNGNQLGPLLRRGIPQTPKLSPMPQYSDLSNAEIGAIVRWIHYARQQRRLEDLSKAVLPAGNPTVGKTYFDANCASCHTAGRDFAALRAKGERAGLTRQIIRPDFAAQRQTMAVKAPTEARLDEARARHLSLLERFTPDVVGNIAAYIQSW